MNISTITLHGAHNYGAMLQAYALKHRVESMGHTAQVIDYLPDAVIKRNKKLFSSRSPRSLLRGLVGSLSWSEWRTRYRAFEKFKVGRLGLTRRYRTLEELRADPPDCDAYICGSDQIWNPELPFDPAYFLDFGLEDACRIAYAASFGVQSAPQAKLEELGARLAAFDAISVREESGIEIVEKSGHEAKLVVDPTLLLGRDEWLEIAAAETPSRPYIVVYCLEESEEFNETLKRFVAYTGLPAYVISGAIVNRVPSVARVIKSAGPEEFLRLFANAEFIFTNSFHGTAFALNFGRPLVGIRHSTRNGRMSTLLSAVGWPNSQVQAGMMMGKLVELARERAINVNENVMAGIREPSLEFLAASIGVS